MPARWLTSVEPPLWPEGAELWQLAALADAALAPYTALARAGVGPSDRVAVVGSEARARFARAHRRRQGRPVGRARRRRRHRRGHAAARLGRARSPSWRPASRSCSSTATAPPRAAADWPRLVAAEAHVFGVVGGHPDLLPELVALVVRGQLPLAVAVRAVAAADADAARAAYAADGGALPIVVPAAA